MNIAPTPRTSLQLALIVSAFCLLPSAFGQGALTPVGAPAPAMKSLDQLEARTPVDATHTPGVGTNEFVISQPGSYYLTGNIIGLTNKNGILITANDVTLDLNGFTLYGNGSFATPGNGILAANTQNLTVRNGIVRDWGLHGIDCSRATNSTMEKIRAFNDSIDGILLGTGGIVASCIASSNEDGIASGDGCTISDSVAYNNTDEGFRLGTSCSISKCSAQANGFAGIYVAGNGTAISACAASGNQFYGIDAGGDGAMVCNCSASTNQQHGLLAGNRSVVKDCVAFGNGGSGIVFQSDCVISGNNASKNAGNGFLVLGQLNRIDGNTANGNTGNGILWVNDLVIRNSCFLNAGGNYSPTVGTGNTGPINAASSSSNPWANF